MGVTALLGALSGSYLIGSIPTAYLLVSVLKRVDIRTVGSGNVGATNVTRLAGLWAGVLVLLIDGAKGALAARLVARALLPEGSVTLELACGLAAVLGHDFPVWLGWRGGKGVATTIGVLLGTMPAVGAVWLGVWIAGFLLSRYVSVASLAAAAALPMVQLALRQPLPQVGVGLLLGLLIIARHRANIVRLLQGREHRVGS